MRCFSIIFFALLILPASARVGFGGLFGGLFGGGGNTAEDQLMGVMQAAQQSLSTAERHHEKVVKKTRKQAEADFQKEGLIAGQAVRHYVEDLRNSNSEYEKSVLAAQQAVADSNAAEAKIVNSWNSPGMGERAHLNALASSSDREVQKAKRWLKQGSKEAEDKAESPFEDDTTKLSRKLGDLSSFIDEAKAAVAKEVQQALDAPQPAAKKIANSTLKSPANATADMVKAEAKLKEARAVSMNATKVAEKRMVAALTQMEKDLKIDVDTMMKQVNSAEEQEIKKVRAVPTMAPSKSKNAKAAPIKSPKASHEQKTASSAQAAPVKSVKPAVVASKK